jgi:hypothetical protein
MHGSNTERELSDGESLQHLISRDITPTSTMDLLRTHDSTAAAQPFLEYFIEAVECPGITQFDPINWHRFKHHAIELAADCAPLLRAIIAVSMLSKAIVYSLSVDCATQAYRTATDGLQELVRDSAQDFNTALAVSFLLCQLELIHCGEMVPFLREPGDGFLKRLKAWAQSSASPTAVSSRVIIWLRIMHCTTRPGGRMGLLSTEVYNELPSISPSASTSIHSRPGEEIDIATNLFEPISAPIFEFYFRIQLLSGEITTMTHYHRSRATSKDQDEVIQQTQSIKSRLRALWDSRCAVQRHSNEELLAQLPPKVAEWTISLVSICHAAYHVEFVELDRVRGDPVSKFTDSRPAITAIRGLVESSLEFAHYLDKGERKLNSGFMRPLFLCAIEAMNAEENQWAVESFERVQNPIYRSNFFAAFVKA